MIGKIPDQDGIAAATAALERLDHAHIHGYDALRSTLKTLKIGHNETVDFRVAAEKELAALRSRVDALPFLRPPGSTAPGV